MSDVGLTRSSAQVVPGLWIGGQYAAVPASVTQVVTIANTAPALGAGDVTAARTTFADSRWQPVPTDVVAKAIGQVGYRPTLVRCRHGLNRSALVAALVLRTCGWGAESALDAVRRARPGAFTSFYFRDLVVRWPDDPMAGR